MKTRKQKMIIGITLLSVIFASLIILFFVYRNVLLQKAIDKVSTKMERDYNSTFSVKKASFIGFSGVSLSEVILVPKNADTLFNIDKMKTSASFWHLLIGDIQLGTLEIKDGFVQLVKNEKGKNFEAFLKKDKNQTIKENTNHNNTNWCQRIENTCQRTIQFSDGFRKQESWH